MLVTIPITEASYRFIEMPIRRGAIGNWLRRERRRPSAATLARRRQLAALGVGFTVLLGWAGVSIAMAPNRCVGDDRVLAGRRRDTADAASPTTPIPSATGRRPPPSTTIDQSTADRHAGLGRVDHRRSTTVAPTTTRAGRRSAAARDRRVGDARRRATARGRRLHRLRGEERGRASDIATVVGQLRAAGRIGSTIVIQTGTNGPVDAATLRPDHVVPARRRGAQGRLPDRARRPKGWIDGNNELIRALPGRYPENVTVLDWAGLGASIEGELSGSDGGVHLRHRLRQAVLRQLHLRRRSAAAT